MNQNDQMLKICKRALLVCEENSKARRLQITAAEYRSAIEWFEQALNHTPDTGDHVGDSNKMVRLTDDSLISIYLACKAEWKATNKRQRERIAVMFGKAVIDAMMAKNGDAK